MSAVPEQYEPGYDFTDFQESNPDTPLPADELDLQLEAIAAAINTTQDRLAEIQNDDGTLKNASVGAAQLKSEVTIGLNAASNWLTGVFYETNDTVYHGNNVYRCLETHTSGTFATDLAAGKWTLILDLNQHVSAASASATQAATSAIAASASENHAFSLATAVSTMHTDFNNHYQTAASAPSTRYDGTALVDGDLYYNTTTGKLFIRRTGLWHTAADAINATTTLTYANGDASTTSFSVTYEVGKLEVYVNGVRQRVNSASMTPGTDYDVGASNGTSVTFASAPPTGTRNIQFVAYGTFSVADVADGSIDTPQLAGGAVTPEKVSPGAYWYAVASNEDLYNIAATFSPPLTALTNGTVVHLRPRVGNGNGTAKVISSLTSSGTTATAACTGHGLHTGEVVYLQGATQGEYNGFVQVETVPNANSFTYNFKGSSTSPATGTIYLVPPLAGGSYAGEVTFNPNGLGAKPVRRRDGGPLQPGDIVKDHEITLIYNSTEEQWLLQNGDVPQFYCLVSSNVIGGAYQATAQTLIGSRTMPMLFCVRMAATNGTTTPTFELVNAPDEMIGPIRREGGLSLRLGDIVAGGWSLLQWAGAYWELLNPRSSVVPIAVLQHQMPNNTHGGTATGGAWETSPLNMEVSDPENIVTLSGNQFTLGPGTYLISFYRMWRGPGTSQARLYNASAGTPVAYGHVVYCYHSETSRGDALVTITESRNFTIQSRVEGTVATYGFGYASNFGGVEVYGGVTIQKVA